MQQQFHASGSVRHTEKRRNVSCLFANRIARACLDAYNAVVPRDYRNENKSQTCVAAVVAHFSTGGKEAGGSNGQSQGQLQVMGLGVGTKFLPNCILREEELNSDGECYGKRLRDCHAEVLAVRAFRRQLALEILKYNCLLDERGQGPPIDEASDTAAYSPILEPVKGSDGGNGNIEPKNAKRSNRRYRLKSNVTLHFYASSAPCGNATLKKFVKIEREKFDSSLGPDQWPEQPHEPIAAHSLRLGQFSLLVKRDGSILSPQSQLLEQTPEEVEVSQSDGLTKHTSNDQHHRRKIWPCFQNDDWCPPSTSIPNFNKGTLHSCSDKICRWNCLGMQGSLLMAVLESPLYMTTMTVGRKFSKIICQRALCCRASGFSLSKVAKVEDGGKGTYRLNHPVLMETSVYMDESGTHDMTGIKNVGQDASFDSNLCWVWWPGKACSFGYAADCLEIGLRIKYHHSINGNVGDNQDMALAIPPTYSECCTYAMIQIFMEIVHGCPLTADLDPKFSLNDILRLKRNLSLEYESAKKELFHHRVFTQWTRRGCHEMDDSR